MKKILIIFSILLISLFLIADYYNSGVYQAEIDLDGDKDIEKISFKSVSNDGDFILKINDLEFEGCMSFMSDDMAGFIIIDIDTLDSFKEIIVMSSGRSDDIEYLILGYEVDSIFVLGNFPHIIKFLGNGTIVTSELRGFWFVHNKYVLDTRTRKLKYIPQDLFYVGTETEVYQGFPIYKTENFDEIVDNVRKGSEITILSCILDSYIPASYIENICNDSDLFLIRTENKLLGWAKLGSFKNNVNLRWLD